MAFKKLMELKVSILVFVEVALGHLCRILKPLLFLGFNPCFRGSRPRTKSGREGGFRLV